MSDNLANELPLVDDSIKADDAGFSSNVDAPISEPELEGTPVVAETKAELKEQIEQAVEDGASEEEVKQMIQEFELTVNGKKIKKTIDLSDKEQLKRELQLAAAGQQAMQQKAQLEKVFEHEINRLKKDPASVLKELGMDPEEWAESLLRSKVEEMKKSPEQIEKERIQKELADTRAKLKQQEEEASRIKFERLQEQQATKIESEISEALDAHKTLPKTPRTVRRIADAMLWAMENGYEDVSVADVIPSVEEEIRTELNSFMEDMPEELVEKYISKKAMDKMRKRRLGQGPAKPNTLSSVKPTSESAKLSEASKQEAAQKIRAKNYFKTLGKNG